MGRIDAAYAGRAAMDTRHLEEFLVFAEELNYTAASKRLFITRPTLVEHMNELENELGCKLITKEKNAIALTYLGNRFVKTASELLMTVSDTIQEYKSLEKNLLVVRIAASNLPWLETLLYQARKHIYDGSPQKQVEIVTTSGPYSTADALINNVNDLVVASFKDYLSENERVLPEGICKFKIKTEEIKFLMTPDNPLFKKREVMASDLDGAKVMLPPDLHDAYLRDKVVEHFASYGARIELLTKSFSDHAEYFNYDFGSMIGIVPTTLISRFGIAERVEYRAFALVDLPLKSDFYFMYCCKFAESENGKLFIDTLKSIAVKRQ